MKRKLFCQLSPAAYRVAVVRCCAARRVRDRLSGIRFAVQRQEELLPQVVYRRKSLIRRRLGNVDMDLQENKAVDLALAAPIVSKVLYDAREIEPAKFMTRGESIERWKPSRERAVRLFVLALACTALANGLGNNILSNYFSEVFQTDSLQRGLIEIPRESPGILCMVLVAGLGFLGNLWTAVIAQTLVLVGMTVMGLLAPSYGVMLVFLFLHSMGMHLFMPLNDSISMELAQDGQVGAALGRFKAVTTLGSMVSACLVFLGFRTGVFSFQSRVILPFVIAALATAVAIVLLCAMVPAMGGRTGAVRGHRLLLQRRYLPYYMVTLAYGCQKRIKIVFAPWVIINLLGQGADTLALLTIATHLAGTWAAPRLGGLLDRLGVRKMLWIEAAYIAASFSIMGLLAGGLADGSLAAGGWRTGLVFGAYVLCVLFEQFNMVHAFMMRSLAQDQSEVTRTLSVGLSVDHVMAIVTSPLLGLVWEGWGVQYVFYLAALSALLQLAAARMTRSQTPA